MDVHVIGSLILQELKKIRIDIKDELRKLCNEIKLLRSTNEKETNMEAKEKIYKLQEKTSQSLGNGLMEAQRYNLETTGGEMIVYCTDPVSIQSNNSPVPENVDCEAKSDSQTLKNIANVTSQSLDLSKKSNVDKTLQQLSVKELFDQNSNVLNETDNLAVISAYPVVIDVKSLYGSDCHFDPSRFDINSTNSDYSEVNKTNSTVSKKCIGLTCEDFCDSDQAFNFCTMEDQSSSAISKKCSSFLTNLARINGERSVYILNSTCLSRTTEKSSIDKKYKFEQCENLFKQKSYENRFTYASEKPNECNACDVNFSTKSDLNRHTRIHTRENLYKCDISDKIFSIKSDLTCHTRIHTEEKRFKCDKCEKCFAHNMSLIKHRWVHTQEKPFKCVTCDKSFSQKGNLSRHTRIHTGEKPYKCNICDKSFLRKYCLKDHSRIHTGEKPYKCKICDKRFIRKYDMINHTRIHTGEKPYKCNICDKSFSQNGHLSIHTRIHTGEKPYQCKICDKSFSIKASMVSHTQIHFRNKP